MKTANYIISAITAAVGAVFLWVGQSYGAHSLDGVTTAASWPNLLSAILIGLSVLLAASTALSRKDAPAPLQFKSPEFQAVLRTILLVLAYTVSFCYLGCLLTNLIFVPIFLLTFGERNWKILVFYDVGLLVFVYVVFELILSSRLARPFFL